MKTSPHPFTLRQLQYVCAVAEHLNFRRAAEACHVSQPALSVQVAQVEESLGVQLFERGRPHVRVAPAATKIIAMARALLVDANDIATNASRLGDPLRGTLRFGAIPTVGPYILPALATAARSAFPHLTCVWREEKTDTLTQKLRSGELDAAVIALEAEIGALAFEHLTTDPFVLAASAEHPLGATTDSIALDALADAAVLLLDDGHCFRDQALEVCARAGADELAVRATSLPTLVLMVAGNLGVTLLPAMSVPVENRDRALTIRPIAPEPPARTIALAWRPGSSLEDALRTVAAVFRDALQPI